MQRPWVQYESEQGIPYYVNNVTGVVNGIIQQMNNRKIRIIKKKETNNKIMLVFLMMYQKKTI